jgi:hypothetical protein
LVVVIVIFHPDLTPLTRGVLLKKVRKEREKEGVRIRRREKQTEKNEKRGRTDLVSHDKDIHFGDKRDQLGRARSRLLRRG